MTNLNETNEAARQMLHELHAAMGRDLEKLDTLSNIEFATEQAETTLHILLGFQFALDFIGNGFTPRAIEAVGEEVFGGWAADAMRAHYMARIEGIDRIEDEDKRAAMLADLLREAMSGLN